jgi:hypothetical protein
VADIYHIWPAANSQERVLTLWKRHVLDVLLATSKLSQAVTPFWHPHGAHRMPSVI